MPVNTPHKDYGRFASKWKRIRDVSAGQDEVHAAGEAYLPKLHEQDVKEYANMVKRTPFVNFSWRTMAALCGMLFRKPAVTKFPTGLERYLKDVTQCGVPFDVFAQAVALEVLQIGRVGVLVDRPPMPDGQVLTVAQAEELGLRPTMQTYCAENIINWKHRQINNKYTLSMVVLHEMVPGLPAWGQVNDEFNQNMVDQWRVLDLEEAKGNIYRVRLFQRKPFGGSINEFVQIGSDVYPMLNGKQIASIPFYFITPEGTEAKLEEPPLLDLVDLNLAHYRVSADYEHGCHFTGLPTPWIAGAQPVDPEKPETYYIGSTAAWVFANENAKCDYLEFSGKGLDALKDNLASKEAQMAAIGARMLAPEKNGVEAAETLFMRHSGENSILSAIAIAVGNGLTEALNMFAAWAEEAGEVSFAINRDFMPIALDGRTLVAYMGLVQNNMLSHQSLFNILQRSDVIDSELTFEQEQQLIEAGSLDAAKLLKLTMGLTTPPGGDPANNGNPDPKAGQ